jgi:hypothetical protein
LAGARKARSGSPMAARVVGAAWWHGRCASARPPTGTSMWPTAQSPRLTHPPLARGWLASTTPATYRAANDEPRDGRADRSCHAAAGSLGARNRRGNRIISVIPDPGGGPIVVTQLDRSRSWGDVRRASAKVRHCSTVGKCDDTQSAAAGDRHADRPQVRCVREPRALEVRCSWPQHTSESHPCRGRQLTVAARVTDEEAAVRRMPRPVEHRMHLRGLVAPR